MKPKRILSPREIAERVVAELRAEGVTDYPFVPADLDDEIVRWCAANGVESQSPLIVREEMATLPAVQRVRMRMKAGEAHHRYIRRRQRARGEENDRPTIYFICDVQDGALDALDSPVAQAVGDLGECPAQSLQEKR